MKKSNQISTLTCLVELLTLNQLRHEKQIEEIQMELAELAATINNVNEQLGKATEEIVTKITELEDALLRSNEMSAEVEAAVASLKASAQALDDLNPDPVPEPTPEPQPEPTPEEPVQ
jgi:chromosome segregation ATPase